MSLNNRHFQEDLFLLDFLKKSLNSRSIELFFEKKTTEKDTLKSSVYLGSPAYVPLLLFSFRQRASKSILQFTLLSLQLFSDCIVSCHSLQS
jgi:hypothetical protein